MKYFEVNFRIEAPAELLQTARDILSALAGETGFETFEETADGLTGYVQQPLLDREALDALASDFPLPHSTVSYDIAEAEYRDWNEQWEQQGFEPIEVGRFVIHDGKAQKAPPSAPEGATIDSSRLTSRKTIEAPSGAVGGALGASSAFSVEIHARQAFGTGTHETTRMMVAALDECLLSSQHEEGLRVLDCGTGTGILAIAALKGGAREAVGYDIDEWSTDNARHNAALNGVADRFTVMLGDVTVLHDVEGTFDVVMANINRNILLADMPAMTQKLAPGGRLLLSGFLADDVAPLLDKANTLGLTLIEEKHEAQWHCLVLKR